MPTYEYKCTNGHTFEAFQGIREEPLSRCTICKAPARRVINGGMGVIFKGSGFYTTDYKKSSALTGGNGSAKDKKTAEASSDKTAGTDSSEKPKEKASKEKAAAS